jgi:hypothetical protein
MTLVTGKPVVLAIVDKGLVVLVGATLLIVVAGAVPEAADNTALQSTG